jgi:hypothetical protein
VCDVAVNDGFIVKNIRFKLGGRGALSSFLAFYSMESSSLNPAR